MGCYCLYQLQNYANCSTDKTSTCNRCHNKHVKKCSLCVSNLSPAPRCVLCCYFLSLRSSFVPTGVQLTPAGLCPLLCLLDSRPMPHNDPEGGTGVGSFGVAYSDPIPEQVQNAHLSQLTLSIKLSGDDQLFSASQCIIQADKEALS